MLFITVKDAMLYPAAFDMFLMHVYSRTRGGNPKLEKKIRVFSKTGCFISHLELNENGGSCRRYPAGKDHERV